MEEYAALTERLPGEKRREIKVILHLKMKINPNTDFKRMDSKGARK